MRGIERQMDRDQRMEAAEAAWNSEGGAAAEATETVPAETAVASNEGASTATPTDGKPAAEEGSKTPAAESKPAVEEKPASAGNDEALRQALGETDSYGQPITVDGIKAELQDARTLYSILDGKASPNVFLDMVQEQYPKVYEQIAARFAKDGKPAESKAAAPGEQAKGGDDPVNQRLSAVEQRLQREDQQRQQAEVETQRRKTVDGFVNRLQSWGKENGLEAEEIDEYGEVISSQIGRDPAAMKRIEAGNFVDVDRLLTERHNKLQARLKARSDAAISSKQERDRGIPKTPAGGAPPAPATTSRPNLADRDARIAAATDAWKQS